MQEIETEIKMGVDNPVFQIEEIVDLPATGNDAIKITKIDSIDIKKEKRKVWKSLICLCVALSLGFSASITLIDSITSLYPNGNLGITALAVVGAGQFVSSAFLVSVGIKLLGCLNILRLGLITNLLFVIAFFYPNWVTLLIGAIFFGFSAAVLFSAGFMYANSAGYWLVKLSNNNNYDAVLVRVSGMVNASLGGGFIWGNIALYFILGPPPVIDENISQDLCGASYCNQEINLTTLQPPSPDSYYTLIGVLTTMSVLACAMMYFLEDFSDKLGQVRCTKKEAWSVFLNMWKLFKNPKGFLLVPITVATAMEEAFLLGDLTQALISCSLGISMVGLVMMAFGVSEVIVSLGNWPLVQKFGRPFILGAAVFVLILNIVTLLLWKPNPHQVVIYFVLVCLWGAADAVLVSVIFATYGKFFEENMEGAFAAASFWMSSGLLFWFAWSQFICVDIKLYFIILVLSVSLVLYIIVERTVSSQKNETKKLSLS